MIRTPKPNPKPRLPGRNRRQFERPGSVGFHLHFFLSLPGENLDRFVRSGDRIIDRTVFQRPVDPDDGARRQRNFTRGAIERTDVQRQVERIHCAVEPGIQPQRIARKLPRSALPPTGGNASNAYRTLPPKSCALRPTPSPSICGTDRGRNPSPRSRTGSEKRNAKNRA